MAHVKKPKHMLFEKACIFLQPSQVKARVIKDNGSGGEDKEKSKERTKD